MTLVAKGLRNTFQTCDIVQYGALRLRKEGESELNDAHSRYVYPSPHERKAEFWTTDLLQFSVKASALGCIHDYVFLLRISYNQLQSKQTANGRSYNYINRWVFPESEQLQHCVKSYIQTKFLSGHMFY